MKFISNKQIILNFNHIRANISSKYTIFEYLKNVILTTGNNDNMRTIIVGSFVYKGIVGDYDSINDLDVATNDVIKLKQLLHHFLRKSALKWEIDIVDFNYMTLSINKGYNMTNALVIDSYGELKHIHEISEIRGMFNFDVKDAKAEKEWVVDNLLKKEFV